MIKVKILVCFLMLLSLLAGTPSSLIVLQAEEIPEKWSFETVTQPASAYQLAFQGTGFVWATGSIDIPSDLLSHGVSRLNRQTGEVTTFKTTNSGILSNKVYDVFADSNGDVWFATDLGISQLSESKWINYTNATNPLIGPTQAIAQKHDGTLLFVSGRRVLTFDGTTWGRLVEHQWEITDIMVDTFNRTWLITYGFPLLFENNGGWYAFSVNGVILNAYSVAIAPNGDAYFGTLDGIGQIVNGQWSLDPTLRIAYSMTVDNRNVLWVTTGEGYGPSGFFEKRPEGWYSHAPSTTGLISFPGQQHRISSDSQGIIWAGTGNYLSSYNGTVWDNFLVNKPFAFSSYISDAYGRSFALHTFTVGATIYSDQKWQGYAQAHGMHGNNVKMMEYDNLGNLYALVLRTTYGLSKFDGQNWSTVRDNLGNAKFTIDDENNIWMYEGDAVRKFDGQNLVTYTTANGLQANQVRALAHGAGILTAYHQSWEPNISRFQDGIWSTHPKDPDNMLNGEVIVNFAADPRNGDFWMAHQNRVASYDGTNWAYFTPGGIVNDIIVLPNGEVWVMLQTEGVRYLPTDRSIGWQNVDMPTHQGGGQQIVANEDGSVLWFSMNNLTVVRLLRVPIKSQIFVPVVTK